MPPDPSKLSPRQAEIFEYLFRYTLRHGYQPSLKEICDDRATSLNSLKVYLTHLQAKGWIVVPENQCRAIRLLRNLDGSPFRGLVPAPVSEGDVVPE
jgi:SOS-response transcriptional repressor LexA